MRIYLSSYRMGRRAHLLQQQGGHALVVMNALDEYPQRMLSWDREAGDLGELGYSSQELDLREYWDRPARDLENRLRTADLMWVVGGNAFVLARAAAAAGLSDALAGNPQLTYAGYSAGACLTSVDLQGIEVMDDSEVLPAGYCPTMPAETLDLTGTRIIPHAGQPDAQAAAERLRSAEVDFVNLADGDDWLLGFGAEQA